MLSAARSFLLIGSALVMLSGCDRVEALLGEASAEAEAAAAEDAAGSAAGAESPGAAKAASPGSPGAPDSGTAPHGGAAPHGDAASHGDAAPATADTALPCIVGRWDAVEYTEAVRRAINKDPQLRSMKKTSSGGHITYVVEPPGQSGNTVLATADALKYVFAGKVQGIGVRVDITINGETEASYTLVGDDRLEIARPTRNDMKVRARVKLKGLGATRRRDQVDLDFDGSFVYACTEDTLEVWRGDHRRGRSMVFKRGEG